MNPYEELYNEQVRLTQEAEARSLHNERLREEAERLREEAEAQLVEAKLNDAKLRLKNDELLKRTKQLEKALKYEQQLRKKSKLLQGTQLAQCTFLYKISAKGLNLEGLMVLCNNADWTSAPSARVIEDYTEIDKERSKLMTETCSSSASNYQTDPDIRTLNMSSFQLKHLGSHQLQINAWVISDQKLTDFVIKKLFAGNSSKCQQFIQSYSNKLSQLRSAFSFLHANQFNFFEIAHVQVVTKIFLQGIFDHFDQIASVSSTELSVQFKIENNLTLLVCGKTDLEVGNGHIEVKRPFDQLYKTDAAKGKAQLIVENEGFWTADGLKPFGVGLIFDLFVLWLSYRDKNGAHFISSPRVIDPQSVVLRILLLGVKDLNEQDLIDLTDLNEASVIRCNSPDLIASALNDDSYDPHEKALPSNCLSSAFQSFDPQQSRLRSGLKYKNFCSSDGLEDYEREQMQRDLVAWDRQSRREPLLTLENLQRNADKFKNSEHFIEKIM